MKNNLSAFSRSRRNDFWLQVPKKTPGSFPAGVQRKVPAVSRRDSLNRHQQDQKFR
jgi:hypothetical protein